MFCTECAQSVGTVPADVVFVATSEAERDQVPLCFECVLRRMRVARVLGLEVAVMTRVPPAEQPTGEPPFEPPLGNTVGGTIDVEPETDTGAPSPDVGSHMP